MSAPQIHLPRHSVSPRHLYRHLLREASYLPPICAPYVSARIQKRFRAPVFGDPRVQRVQARITDGRRQLRRLQAANSGDWKQMHNVLLHTFGRKGQLRRTLLSQFVQTDCLANPSPATPGGATAGEKKPDSLARVREVYERANMDTRYKKNFLNRWNMVDLQAFLGTQYAHSAATTPRVWYTAPLSGKDPTQVPKENIWGRPLPLRELRSRLKTWWLNNLPRLMPPTGAGEWNTLRDLAVSNEIGPLLQMPPRRPVAVPVDNEETPKPAWSNLQPYASIPVSRIEKERRQGFTSSARGLSYEPLPRNPKRLSNRKLRRLCGWIFEISPVLTGQPGDRMKRRVKWGHLVPDLPVASPELSSFFEDVDETGSVPTGPNKQKTEIERSTPPLTDHPVRQIKARW